MAVSQCRVVVDQQTCHGKVACDGVGVLFAQCLQFVPRRVRQRTCCDLLGDLGHVASRRARLPRLGVAARTTVDALAVRTVAVTLLIRLLVIPVPVRAVAVTLLIRLPIIPVPVRAVTITLLIRLPIAPGGRVSVIRGVARATRALAVVVVSHQLWFLLLT
ncbi:hypothetical protein, partial [Microbacterium sp. UBA3394]|uniref:hypothetical protein n=1 Tax=Microbacterium sp. UBA3394 TaxID=1946945 RepID=UPI00257AF804